MPAPLAYAAPMESTAAFDLDKMDTATALALLQWQVELGADAPVADSPVDCYAMPDRAPWLAKPAAAAPLPGADGRPARAAPQPIAKEPQIDPVAEAERAAKSATSLDSLQAALAGFEHCALKRGARNLVFSDGNPAARVMVLGEAPGREEDQAGKPFVGPAGHLLDKMLAAIGLDRSADSPDSAAYITNVLPWRPPQNRDPEPAEIAMMRPFVARHIELAQPELILLVGNIACDAALGRRGITRLRGIWGEAFGRPAMPIFHPAYLLRRPEFKRETWTDLLALKARLGSNP